MSTARPRAHSRAQYISRPAYVMPQHTPLPSQICETSRRFESNATIVLVGSRGAGKRSLAFIGATHLGRRLITEDHYFQLVTGLSRRDYLSRHGSKEFARRNVEVLQRMLDENRTDCIIECGMSSLATESQKALRYFAETHPVIHILRNPARIRQLLNLTETAAKRLENADLAHRSCSNFEYYNLQDTNCESHVEEISQNRQLPDYSFALKDTKQDFTHFLDNITGRAVKQAVFESPFSLDAFPPESRPHTYVIPLNLSELANDSTDLPAIESGGDAIELRVDLFLPDIKVIISRQVARIRRNLGIPIIFQVDERLSRDGDAMLVLLRQAIRAGVEYLVVPLQLSDETLQHLNSIRGQTKLIGQFADQQSSSWGDQIWLSMYERAREHDCDLVRLLRMGHSDQDNRDVAEFTRRIAELNNSSPLLIAYNLGPLGRSSVIANNIFSPVTHSAIRRTDTHPSAFLITAQEAMQSLYQTHHYDSLRYYTFGAHVSYSLTPTMHSLAYYQLGMIHEFIKHPAKSIDELVELSRDPHFGGAGISQPFKVEIMSRCVAHSRHAKAIGASNTIIPLRALPDGSPNFFLKAANQRLHAGPVVGWFGDNTDFIGILQCLRRNASPRNVVQPSKTTGLVIGAGGMARATIYAMILLGCRNIFIYNRTVSNAEAVANHFNSWAGALSEKGTVVTVLRSKEEDWPRGWEMPTFLVSCVPAHMAGLGEARDFEVPEQWLGSPSGGVALELAYKPLNTPLVRQMRRLRHTTGRPWAIVDGLEFIPAQSVAQFELVTGRRAPRREMRKAAQENYEAITGSSTESMT